MNFKPSKWKVIGSILIILIINIFGMSLLGGCERFLNCYIDSLIGIWFFWLLLLIIIYTIWSLFEKNKKRKK